MYLQEYLSNLKVGFPIDKAANFPALVSSTTHSVVSKLEQAIRGWNDYSSDLYYLQVTITSYERKRQIRVHLADESLSSDKEPNANNSVLITYNFPPEDVSHDGLEDHSAISMTSGGNFKSRHVDGLAKSMMYQYQLVTEVLDHIKLGKAFSQTSPTQFNEIMSAVIAEALNRIVVDKDKGGET